MTETTNEPLEPKSVFELIGDKQLPPNRYWIPAYQRGYRWTPSQVVQLLDDLLEFLENPSKEVGEFYCLQPLVVVPHTDGRIEVVDGQQRLTTIFLILTYFNKRLIKEERDPIYEIEFETRDGFAEFIDNLNKDEAKKNIDFHHVFEAMKSIEEWFKERLNLREALKNILLNETKVIRYELPAGTNDSDAVDAFTRLNVGKIPLTDEELVRAMFLQQGRDGVKSDEESIRLRVASEWDRLEQELQAPDLWYFLTNEKAKDGTRIGLLLEMVACGHGMQIENADYEIFLHFQQRLQSLREPTRSRMEAVEFVWNEIKEMFLAVREWFDDRYVFHLIGYLVHQGVSLVDLRNVSKELSKTMFRAHLRGLVYKELLGGAHPMPDEEAELREKIADQVSDFDYSKKNQHDGIRSLFLLFNLTTLLGDGRSNIRFQFDSFKEGKWDLEHIHSVADQAPTKEKEQKEWLGEFQEFLECFVTDVENQDASEDADTEAASGNHDSEAHTTDTLFKRVRELSTSPEKLDKKEFASLYNDMNEHFKSRLGVEANHSDGVRNLALLDQYTNRSYKNAPFPIKRQRLLKLDRAGIFVPLCTRNVFLKCYSRRPGDPWSWSEKDRDGYEGAIVNTLVNFFTDKEGAAL